MTVWIPSLSTEAPDGATPVESLAVLEVLQEICPFTEMIRWGHWAFPTRGPSRFFGGDLALAEIVATRLATETGHRPHLGIADGLFWSELAAHQGRLLAPGATSAFAAAQPLAVLGDRAVATIGERLGWTRVGEFAAVAPARVRERFGAGVEVLHRLARGERSEHPAQRDVRLPRQLAALRGETILREEQLGFFGQRGDGERRAEAAVTRLHQRLGDEAVVFAQATGGRRPEDRARWMRWGAPRTRANDVAPWPAQLGAPAPMRTLRHPVALELLDAWGAPVHVTRRGVLSSDPDRVRWSARGDDRVRWFAGPWPLWERWWHEGGARAHLQLVLASGAALLVRVEGDAWVLTGVYD